MKQLKPDKSDQLPVFEPSEKRSQEELLRQVSNNKTRSNNGKKGITKQLSNDGLVTAK